MWSGSCTLGTWRGPTPKPEGTLSLSRSETVKSLLRARRRLAAMTVCAHCGRESPDDFEFCPGCGAQLAGGPVREVRKVVTVLFCDLTGSTALGERTDPEALRALMNRYYDTARTVLERHGGTVEKFVGDAVMAVFGVPVANEDDALRATRAAVEMRGVVQQLGLQARIGGNTGTVVAGEGR